ncbi:MAG: hypothetical protein HY202_04110, partial [Nitrospirae bacterium]|nr:hypothetical protein [Nitrospirota bacterium]
MQKHSRLTRSLFILFMTFGTFSESGSLSNLLAYDVVPVTQGGELAGTIKFKGNPPSNQSHQVVNNSEFCGSTVEEETYLITRDNKGLGNVVISIEDISRGKKPLSADIIIENRHCRFVPHVQTGMVGNSYEIRNSDPVLHNTHLHMEGVSILNIAMPAGGKNIKKAISQKGVISTRCDAHKFMQGWIYVTENPYVAVTNKEGNYRISDIPPGKYKIKVWHEGLPAKEKEITIFPDKKT